jgi:ribokinase
VTALVITGYASLDYSFAVAGEVSRDRTTRISRRDPRAWPRLGGSPAYVGAAAFAGGMEAFPLCWVGDDAEGETFQRRTAALGLATTGIAAIKGERSPVCILVHEKSGGTACLFDPGMPGREALSGEQRSMLRAAEHICITVGPVHLVQEILGLCPADAKLYWIAKNDPAAFPAEACRAIGARASIAFFNAAERSLIASTLNAQAIAVETRGAEGVSITHGERTIFVPADAVIADDPTGAGDTFAGAFIASLFGSGDPVSAAQSGMTAARGLLAGRASNRVETA